MKTPRDRREQVQVRSLEIWRRPGESLAGWKARTDKASRLHGLGEPAHLLQFYLGLQQKDGVPVTEAMKDTVLRQLHERFGAYTTYDGHGRWRDEKTRKLFDEPSMIFSVVRNGSTATCNRTKGLGRNAARAIAKSANQFAVLLVTTCADGKVDAELVETK